MTTKKFSQMTTKKLNALLATASDEDKKAIEAVLAAREQAQAPAAPAAPEATAEETPASEEETQLSPEEEAAIKAAEENGGLNPLYNSSKATQEFARRLFRRTILNADYYRHLISENTKNWDLDRVAFMDVIVMQTALAEILSFPNIPVSVSLNEYVEIAKLYSTAKSGSFINGTLDGIVNQLKKEGKLAKN